MTGSIIKQTPGPGSDVPRHDWSAPWSVDLQTERLYNRRPENNIGFETTLEFLGRCVGTGFET
jgi:hypothetical protein